MKTINLSSELILNAIHTVGGMTAWKTLIALGMPEKVVDSAFMRENQARRIEYGVSLRTSWLTPEGELFIGCSYESHD